jgi:hypothetical protein
MCKLQGPRALQLGLVFRTVLPRILCRTRAPIVIASGSQEREPGICHRRCQVFSIHASWFFLFMQANSQKVFSIHASQFMQTKSKGLFYSCKLRIKCLITSNIELLLSILFKCFPSSNESNQKAIRDRSSKVETLNTRCNLHFGHQFWSCGRHLA